MEQTINQVQPVREWVNNEGDTMYVVEILLEGGKTYQVNCKTPDRWNSGDTVVVKKEWEDKKGNLCASLDKPRPAGGYAYSNKQQRKDDDYDIRVGTQWALNAAISYVAACHPRATDCDISEIKEFAKQLLRSRDDIMNMLKSNG